MAILPGSVQKAAPGLSGFDADTYISPEIATQFYNEDYRFCIRYLSLDTPESGDLTNEEAAGILQSGLALMAVQHVLEAPWVPNENLGTEHGQNAATNAQTVGLPPGMNIWCDLEGVSSETTSQAVIDYCQAWYNAIDNAGYVPGLYVGSNCGLTGDQLYYNLSFAHYWQSQSDVPMVATRGYQLIQHSTVTVNGVSIDPDNTQTDNEGGLPLWLINSESS